MEKTAFYYNRFIGETVAIKEWKIDEKKDLVFYREVGSNKWETDLVPNPEPKFFESKTECISNAADIRRNEEIKYSSKQTASSSMLVAALLVCYNDLDIMSWKRIRKRLGKDKCDLITAALAWQEDDKENIIEPKQDDKEEA